MTETGYECCGGKCCRPNESEVTRRSFLKAAGATAGGATLLLGSAAAESTEPNDALAAWNASLLDRGDRKVFRGVELDHIAFPLGGIGAGQVYLKGDGSLNPWQIVNNFNVNANVAGSFFGIRVQQKDSNPVARVLQQGANTPGPGVTAVEFAGEFPLASLRYLDGALPVAVELDAYSPCIPMNTKDSALPCALFQFRIRNTGRKPVDVSLMAAMPNLAGWTGYTAMEELLGPEMGYNVNTAERFDGGAMVSMGVLDGTPFQFSVPFKLHTNDRDVAFHLRYAGNVDVRFGQSVPIAPPASADAVYWYRDDGETVLGDEFAGMFDAVDAGATLIYSCGPNSLLMRAESAAEDSPLLLEDWGKGSYDGWTVEGDAFGASPASGTLPGQQTVSGYRGTYYINSFHGGDDTRGRMTSRLFVIDRDYIHLQVGGGRQPNLACVNLRIDGQVVASATGDNTERLRPVRWDVATHKGKQAQIEILDQAVGGWGHILAGEIYVSHSPASPYVDPALIGRARQAMPISWTDAQFAERDGGVPPGWETSGISLRPGSSVLGQSPVLYAGACGRGRIVLCLSEVPEGLESFSRKSYYGQLIANAIGSTADPITGVHHSAPHYGSMALAVLGDKNAAATSQSDDPAALWASFVERGGLDDSPAGPSEPGRSWYGALASSFALRPGKSKEITFVLAWHFPNRTKDRGFGWAKPEFEKDARLGNQYNHWFESADDVAKYVASHVERLSRETRLFHQTMHDSTLPRYVLDAVTANVSTVQSPIYVWTEDGTVGGFEGADRCCPMNCTHVYNYVMTPAFLWPELERNVRETDLLVQMHPTEHYIPHRTVLPLSEPRLGFEIGGPHHPALDGQLGTLLKLYREVRMHGDIAWLEKLWGRARDHLLYLMKTHDPQEEGIIRGEQPNTYDIHTYGSNTFIGSLYLAALRAMEEMARLMNDSSMADLCRARFEKARGAYDQTCWNGSYYINVFDAPGATPETYEQGNCWGIGCHADQLLGQWWANILGLGHVLPEERVRTALQSVHANCWRTNLVNHKHTQRVFAEGDEKGLLTCVWPEGGRPRHPVLYCDEVWTGLEYHVAACLIHEGRVVEGLQIVRGARDRYTGNQRNPWAELECGYHYARAMSAQTLLNAAAGLVYNAVDASLEVNPKISPDQFRCFFTGAGGWGTVGQERTHGVQTNHVRVVHGNVGLNRLTLTLARGSMVKNVLATYGRRRIKAAATRDGDTVTVSLSTQAIIDATHPLTVRVETQY
ncbi:MAG: hypothetical protein AMXMBFR84_09070 [Candidatus Hydrogenedentota bacterium]